MLAWSPWGLAVPITQLELKSSGELARLSMEAPLGMLIDAGVSGRGEAILLRLKGAEKADVEAHIAKFQKNPLFKSARILPGEGDEVRLLLEFSRPISILDETILALPGQISRWEAVVGEAGAAKASVVVAPEIGQIDAARRNGRVDVTLTGSLGLVAEASFQDAPPRLVVNLPGVPLQQAVAAAGKFYGEAGLIKSVRAFAGKHNVTTLEFDLTETADLIDTQGLALDKQGQVILSLVPDARVDKKKAEKLGSLGFEVSDGVMQMRLVGVAGGRLNAYTIEEPSRLVVDFLGWKPEQVQEALARFGDRSVATLGKPRLDVTRLGSARAVFDLAVSAPFQNARALRLPVDGSVGTFADNYLISLSPKAGASQQLQARRHPLDLSFRRELMEGREPEIVVRPPTLDNADRYAMAALKPQGASQFSLMNLFGKAMETDAKYLAAKAEFDAAKEVAPQARAGYLPTASFDYQLSGVKQNILRAANVTFPTGETDYASTSLLLTITQPIYKPQAWIKMGQAELAVNQARLSVVAAEQDLILRVAVGYLGLLAANDGVDLARAERMAVEKQNEDAKLRLESGLGTVAHAQDTEARLSLTRAREIEAENRVEDARLALKEIVGENVSVVHGFKRDFAASTPLPSAPEPWVDASLEQNLALQGRGLAVEIASMEVRRQRAGHLPTLVLSGNLSRQDAGGSIYGEGQKSDEANLGLRFSLPLTDGGLTASLTREAVARKEKAVQEREQESRRTERLTRSSFNGVVTSAKTLEAMRQSVAAQESALETRLEGYRAGLYNVLAVMDAYRLYYAAQRDFLQARYDYLTNRLKLRQAVGSLSRGDLEDIAALLQ